MKNIFLLLLILTLSACVTNPPVENKLKFKYDNDCLPQAIIMTESLKEKNIEAFVLRMYTDKWGHAICVYMYPKGKNQLWAWDRVWKSNRLRAWKDDPVGIAKAWQRLTLDNSNLILAQIDK
jgi:hypothetical protein